MDEINNIFTLHLPIEISKRIEQDRISFLPSSSKSSFVVNIITNYYDLYDAKYQDLTSILKVAIKKEIGSKSLDDYSYENVIWTIYEHMEQRQLSTNKKTGKKDRINIRLNSKNNESLVFILEKTPSGANHSSYLTSILISYLELPKQEREKIIFKDTIDKINNALLNKCKLRFSTSNSTYIANPIGIFNSSEELFNYFVYELDSDQEHKERRMRQVHIRNMKAVSLRLQQSIELSKDYTKKLEQMLKNGVQFGTGDGTIYKVQLTKSGIKKFESSYLEQPKPMNDDYKETGILYLDCSSFQLERYFAPFYKEAKILEPKEEVEKIAKKFEEAYHQYTKKEHE